jgi:hypothetical protein
VCHELNNSKKLKPHRYTDVTNIYGLESDQKKIIMAGLVKEARPPLACSTTLIRCNYIFSDQTLVKYGIEGRGRGNVEYEIKR